MNTAFQEKAPNAPVLKAFTATQIIAKLGQLNGWKLHGDGVDLSIEKTFPFADFLQVISFVNAVAYIAHRNHHYPGILVQQDNCSVRFRTHSVQGISSRDFDSATLVDGLCNHLEQ